MKKIVIIFCLTLSTMAFSQNPEPIFPKGEQSQITSLLKGFGLSAAFNKTGNLRITTNLQNVSVLPNGDFKIKDNNSAWVTIVGSIKSWGFIEQSVDEDVKSRLGKEKFKQLEAIYSKKI